MLHSALPKFRIKMKQPPPPVPILIMAVLGVAKATIHRVRHGDTQPTSKRSRYHSHAIVRQITEEELQPLSEHITRISSMQPSAHHSTECLIRGGGSPQSWPDLGRLFSDMMRLPVFSSAPSASRLCKLFLEALAILLAAQHRQWHMLVLCCLLTVLLLLDLVSVEKGSESISAPSKSGTEAQGPPSTARPNPLLSGTWHKVDDLSDSQDAAADILKIGGFARQAMKMFKGMEFLINDTHLQSTALTKLPFFKAPQEMYALDGSISSYNRRDMRKGKFIGYVKVQECGGLNLYYQFGEPLAGRCVDEIRLANENELHITTHLTVGEETCAYRVVYHRLGSRSSSKEASPSSSTEALSPDLLKLEVKSVSDSESDSSGTLQGSGNKQGQAAPRESSSEAETDAKQRSKQASSPCKSVRQSLDDRARARSVKNSASSTPRPSMDDARGLSPFARLSGAVPA